MATVFEPVQNDYLKELRHGLCILKIFQVCHLQSVLIFSILNHPRSFLVYYYFFSIFLSYQTNICGFSHVNGCLAHRRKRLKIS